MSCCSKQNHGPGYSSPLDAFKNGPNEQWLYVTCVKSNKSCPDYLATVDVDPQSKTYSQIIDRTFMSNIGDELHHSGWNACSSCYNDHSKNRNKLILPCLRSNRIYVLNVDGPRTELYKTIEPEELFRLNLSGPHTSHCLPSGDVMISCMGDRNGQNQGSFLLLNSNFEPYACWNQQTTVQYGYDFWYQPRLNILISTEWTAPNIFRPGFFAGNLSEPNWIDNHYGHSIHLWEFNSGKLLKSIDLRSNGRDACMPLEIRFLHSPESPIGFVGCAYSSNVFRFRYDESNEENPLKIDEVICLKPKKVSGFSGGDYLPALITDIIISMDDQFLFISAWAFGEIRQYTGLQDDHLRMVNRIRLGGMLISSPKIKIINDDEPFDDEQSSKNIHSEVCGRKIRGGAQMLQLSLDGRRLYCTNSLFSSWDLEFYPDMFHNGSQLIKINVNDEKLANGNTLELDDKFIVDFGDEPNGPALAHEMRYPHGDCTSDIWI
uniref:Methanethiol oxidase-like n=1 Tax=Dermatophagoides pteronyssinus TaxID=6956 RepID=A0A6P6Y4U3_DERPT|nr:methanethiol oxidase-like [Dermatophagoides pteronyssinus]